MERPSGKNRSIIGCTRDISILGAFIVFPSPPVQTPVSLETHLPPLERNGLRRLRLTRVTGTDQDSGFAASSCFELRTARDGFVERMRKTSEQQRVAMTQKPALTARNSVYALILNVSAISFCSASGSLYRLEM